MPPRIFINYRREDTAGYAGRLYDALSAHFGHSNVFMDIDKIEPGVDFTAVVRDAVGESDVVLALIGRSWVSAADSAGRRRLDNPVDFVRTELRAALEQGRRIIPVLVQDAEMPAPEELPGDLAPLAVRNALELTDARWRYDVERLTGAIERTDGRSEQPRRRGRLPVVVALVALAAAGGAVAAWVALGSDDSSSSQTRPVPPPPASRAPETLRLAGLLVGPLPDDAKRQGRCFGGYKAAASFVLAGVRHATNFVACGDKETGDPSRASGDFRFRAADLPPGSRIHRFTATAGVDESSSPARAGSSVTWTVFYGEDPICTKSVRWSGTLSEPVPLDCPLPSKPLDTAAVVVRQQVALVGSGAFWAGLLAPAVVYS